MCFSATASFAAAGVLSATGAVTLSKVKSKREIPLASIPLLFGVQQAIEGVVWVSFGSTLLNTIATYGFLFFAYVLWPIFVPVAVMLVEPSRTRKRALKILSFVGLAIGLYLLYYLLIEPSKAHVVGGSIAYDFKHIYDLVYLIPYVLVTAGSGLISSHKILNLFGIAATLSFFVAFWLYYVNFISVWCFFAALLSVIILWFFLRKPVATKPVEAG